MSLLDDAKAVRANAHAPYSGFPCRCRAQVRLGACLRGLQCRERGLPRRHLRRGRGDRGDGAAGERRLTEVAVIADCAEPVSPCGGCRQKLAEFGAGDVMVIMATMGGRCGARLLPNCCPGPSGRITWEMPEGMDARAIISRLRDGRTPGRDELAWFARGLADGTVSDAQAGAFAMCVLLRGLDEEGRVALTLAMRDSGRRLGWDLDGPVIDKHSTGGIGDCVSLVLAPALAACGAHVPMISGRGLGHTGGTLDKLEAIPGLMTEMDEGALRRLVGHAGCAIVGASARIAPADRRLYAVRDVTGTVESLDLITASILSKKLAAGLSGLVLDVKTGSGALMKSLGEARALARALTTTAAAAGCPTGALISDMSQPLAPAIGNAVEVAEAMRVLTGAANGPLQELAAELGAMALCNAGLAGDRGSGRGAILEALANGRAAERFGRWWRPWAGPRVSSRIGRGFCRRRPSSAK